MKICLYTGSALPKLGGQEAVVDSLAREFLRQGHHPTVLAPRPRLPLLPNDSVLPYPVLRHPRFFSTRHLVSWYRYFLFNAARGQGFEVIHCHDVYPTGYVAALGKAKLKIPLVITSHGGDVRAGNVRLNKPGMHSRFVTAIQSADALISIGTFTRAGFLQLQADENKIRAIPNGVDLTPFARPVDRPADLDTSIIPGQYLLFIGRLSRRKGVDVLLEALSRLPSIGKVELVIAGSGDERANLQAMTELLNLQSRVRFVGRVTGDHKTYLLQQALAVVVPSRGWEAFPLVVLESYAAARPVVGSRIAGLEDVVGDAGILVNPESPADWADALQRIRTQTNRLEQLSQSARRRVVDYGWDRVAQEHLKLYQSVMPAPDHPSNPRSRR